MKPLYKSTIFIWTDYDPTNVELEDLAREAVSGDAYCSGMDVTKVEKPEEDPDWDGTEFFLGDGYTITDYEKASGNVVRDGKVFDDGGNYICEYTEEMAENYLESA